MDLDDVAQEQRERDGVSRTVPSLEVHRIAGHVQFHEHGLKPYWGLVSCYEPEHEDVHDGFEACGDHWDIIGSSHWNGKIADPQGRFDDGLLEYQYRLVVDDDVGDRDATLKFRPGYPEAEHVDTGDLIQGIPTELPECLRVQVETTNVDVNEVFPLLRAFFDAIGLNTEYVCQPHEWSRIYEFEGYIRVDRGAAEAHLTGDGGLLQDLAQFGSSEGDKGEYKWDHEDHQGHYEAVALDPGTWDMLIPNQQYAKRLKCYHPQHVRSEASDDDPLSHPKLEVQLWPDAQHESVSWDDARHLTREFQTAAANALQWSGVGLDADSGPFVEDAYHDVDWSDDEVDIYANPIPELEEKAVSRAQDQLLDPSITHTEFDVIEALADGGPKHYDDLPASSSLVYRMAQRLGIVEADNGTIRFPDQITRDRIKTLVERFQDVTAGLSKNLRDVADGLGRLSGDGDDPSALERWMDAHGAVVAGHGRELHFEFPGRAFTEHEIVEILRAGYEAAQRSGFESKYRSARVTYKERSGSVRKAWEIVKDRTTGPYVLGRWPLRASPTA
jgi:hypothetical protein